MREELTRFQKILTVILLAMIALFGLLNLLSRFNGGVTFEGSLLKKTVTEERITYAGRVYDETVVIEVQHNDAADMTEVVYRIGNRITDVCTLERGLPEIQTERGHSVEGVRIHKNGALLFEGGYAFVADPQSLRWYAPDGSVDLSFYMETRFESDTDHWKRYETTPQSIMRFALEPATVCRGSLLGYLVLVLWTLLVLLDVRRPMALFRLQHCCDVRDPEPTDFYLTMQKIGWVLYPILLLAGYIIALRMLP